MQHKAVENVSTTQPVEEENPDLTQTTASSKNKTISIVKKNNKKQLDSQSCPVKGRWYTELCFKINLCYIN